MREFTTKIDVNALLEKVEANRIEHEKIYKEALDGYKKAVIAELEKLLAQAKADEVVVIHSDLYEPKSYVKDYDSIIAMLKMSVEDSITLTQNEFTAYVLDEWQWMDHFLTSNAIYSSSATFRLKGGR